MRGASDRGWWKLPALSGALLGTSYMPGPLLPLNLTAFLPLLAWLHANPDADGRTRLKVGFVFGLVAHLITLHYMYSMLVFSWLASLLYVATAVTLALRISISIVLLGWLRRRTGLSFALLLPIVWLPMEWVQTWGDLRFTGDHLYHSMGGYPFVVQFADLVGPYGVGAFLLVVNGLLFEALALRGERRGRRAALALALVWIAALAYDGWAWTREEPRDETLRVALVQPNIPLAVKHDAATAAEQWRTLVRLSEEAAEQGAELIVWPESARPRPLYHKPEMPETYAMAEVQALARRIGVPLLVGVEYVRLQDGGVYELYNAAMAVDAEGRLLPEWGAKVYLVPFTEAVPFERLVGPLVEGKGGEWQWVAGGFTPGPELALLDVADSRVGVLVCYEQLFPDLPRGLRNSGAELQVVITNDAWWGRSFLQLWQANALRLRAIENRTAFVRVANTGISGFVDSRGRYHRRTALFEEAVEVHEVGRSSRLTVYNRIGDLVAWLAIGGLIAAVVTARSGATAGR